MYQNTDIQNPKCAYSICQYGWNKGKHGYMIIKIKEHFPTIHQLSIGIVSNSTSNASNWLFTCKEAARSHQFYFSRVICDPLNMKSGIYTYDSGMQTYSEMIDIHSNKSNDHWKETEFKVLLD